MNDAPIPPHPSTAPLWLGVQGLSRMWDRRAAETAEGAAAEAYQRAAAEALEVLRALAAEPERNGSAPGPSEQQELGL
jgi:hypothetical protein